MTFSDDMYNMKNIAFIDWQNLHLWVSSDGWKLDLFKFRVFLRDKYKVQVAYYFLWCLNESEQDLYDRLQKAWFIVVFREHNSLLLWKKKWNVDVDIVFSMMKHLIEKDDSRDKMILVSGDWDYKKVVDYMIKKWVFEKIIFPNMNYSSLYRKFWNAKYFCLQDAKAKIQFVNKI